MNVVVLTLADKCQQLMLSSSMVTDFRNPPNIT